MSRMIPAETKKNFDIAGPVASISTMNLTGLVFGSLTVISPASKGNRSWCRCDCGSKGRSSLTVPNSKLLSGLATHCTAKLHERRDAACAKSNDRR